MDQSAAPNRDREYLDSAARAITNKKPVPEIDFTLHTMEDGTQVSTTDRVCKGKSQVLSRLLVPLDRLAT